MTLSLRAEQHPWVVPARAIKRKDAVKLIKLTPYTIAALEAEPDELRFIQSIVGTDVIGTVEDMTEILIDDGRSKMTLYWVSFEGAEEWVEAWFTKEELKLA